MYNINYPIRNFLLGLIVFSLLGMTSLKYTHTHEINHVEISCHEDDSKAESHDHSESAQPHDDCSLCLLLHHQHAASIPLFSIDTISYYGSELKKLIPTIQYSQQDYLARKSNKDPPLSFSIKS